MADLKLIFLNAIVLLRLKQPEISFNQVEFINSKAARSSNAGVKGMLTKTACCDNMGMPKTIIRVGTNFKF